MQHGLGLVLALGIVAAVAPRAQALVWPDVPERLERALASSDPTVRRAAARELSALGANRAAPLIAKAFTDSDVDVRVAAAKSAVHLRIPEAGDIVLGWLGERDSRLRASACEVVSAVLNPRAVQPLARALGDADAQVRVACAEALGAQGTPEAVAPLAGKLDDPTPAVRIEIARSLARIGDPRAVVPLVGKVQDSVPEVRQAVVRALGDLGDAGAIQALLLALRDNVIDVKVEALSSLGKLRAREAASAIAPLAAERSPVIRQAALHALGRIASEDAVRALVRLLGTHEDALGTLEHTPVREALVSAGPRAVEPLTTLLDRGVSPAVGTSAAWVLGELRATAAASKIVAALRKGALPPAAALHALATVGTADQISVVLEFISDPNQAVRDEAIRAADRLLDPSRPDGRAVEPLAAALRSPRTAPPERAALARLLGKTGAPRAAVELASFVGSKEPALRLAAIDALGALGLTGRDESTTVDDVLLTALDDVDPTIRLHASTSVAASGGTKARTTLLAKLDGDDETDRYALLGALGGIMERHPDEGSAQRLFRELAQASGPERDLLVLAAGRARLDAVVSALTEITRSGNADDRRAVATVLGAHRGSSRALALAGALTNDPDATVRAQAAFTLGTLGDSSSLPRLATLAKNPDEATATNAAAAIANIAAAVGKKSADILGPTCALLTDRRASVRTNALVSLSSMRARCGDGARERAFVAHDPNDAVRSAAARVLANAPLAEDKNTLATCSAHDRSADVALSCRQDASSAVPPGPARAVTVFIVGENGVFAKVGAPFLLEYRTGVLRAGVADRRGATFDPAAPPGDLALRRVH